MAENKLAETRIKAEMRELEKIIKYQFNDISQLEKAMRSVLLEKQGGKSNQEYSNDSLACLGDTIIKFLIADRLYKQDKRKGEITSEKSKLENNTVFHRIAEKCEIRKYAYNDKHFVKDNPPDHEKVRSGEHDPYVEVIAAAIYLDGGWEKIREWFEKWLLPKLEQNKSS